jgi:RNA polymerase sigma-B factor
MAIAVCGHRCAVRKTTTMSTTASSTTSTVPETVTADTALLTEMAALPAGVDRARLRDRIIEGQLPLAYRLARRYAGRGEPIEDLRQIAAIALIKTVDRYDPARQIPFAAFATPTIVGEIKRHFRDYSRPIRIPRSSQELSRAAAIADSDLSQHLARTPTATDIAIHLHIRPADVKQAAAATRAAYPTSMDAIAPNAVAALDAVLGTVDPRFSQIDDRLLVQQLIAPLDARERRILDLRYADNFTQAQIATTIGVSQMHVSRLLTRALHTVRAAALRPA